MIKNKFAAKFLLFIMVFSTVSSILPAIGAFANTNKVKTVVVDKKTQTLNDIYKVTTGSTAVKSAGSTPVTQASVITLLDDAEKDGKKFDMIGKDERAALEDLENTDMCGRHDGGWIGLGSLGDSTYLEMLLFLVGDASGAKFDKVTKKSLAEFNLKPDMVPSTNYKCFPKEWKEAYPTKDVWQAHQEALGKRSCGTFEMDCKVEKMIKQWLRRGIVMGMTWILDIATGSGSGEAADACRPNRSTGSGADVIDSNDLVKGFDAASAGKCDSFLKKYYAQGTIVNHDEGTQELAAGTSIKVAGNPMSPASTSNPNGGRTSGGHMSPASTSASDAAAAARSEKGATSVNYKSTKLFYGKSSSIAFFLAMAMIIGAVIQGMVQGKPVVIAKVVLIYVPIFGFGIFLAPTLTKYMLEFIDGISYYMADNSAADINNIAGAFGTTAAGGIMGAPGAAGALGTAGALAMGGLMADLMGKAFMALVIIVGAFIFVSLALWALMMFREASILMVLALLPIALSMAIWPALAKIAQKFIKLLMSLIVSKVPIVMALSMGINMLSQWVIDHPAPAGGVGSGAPGTDAGGMRAFVLATAIFGIALAAPTFVITLFDAVGDMAQTMGSKLHTGAVRGAISATTLKANMGQQFGAAKNGATLGIGGGGAGTALSRGGPPASSPPGAPAAPAPGPGTPAPGAPTATPGSPAASTSTAAPGTAPAGAGTPADDGPGGFWEGVRDTSSQFDDPHNPASRDGRGFPAKKFRNGGLGQHVGNGINNRALRNERKNQEARPNASIGRSLRTLKNSALGGLGGHIHGQGKLNAAGMRRKLAVGNPVSLAMNIHRGAKGVRDVKNEYN